MHYDGVTVGVITLSKLGFDGFDADDLRLLTILADHAATAVETARLLTRSQELAGELRRLLDMSGELSESLDPRQVANLMARHLANAMGVDECAISYWDRSAGRVESLGYFPPLRIDEMEPFFDVAGFPETMRVLERQETVIIDAEDPAADPAEVALLGRTATASLAMLPLVAKGQSIGLVELFSRVGGPLGRPAARARPDDGQRGGDGARERAPVRGRAQARRPRPADRLLQPPVPARAAGRGGRPVPARPPAAERADARPRRLQARQRHVRPPVRRPGPDLGGRGHPVDPARRRTSPPATAATSSP